MTRCPQGFKISESKSRPNTCYRKTKEPMREIIDYVHANSSKRAPRTKKAEPSKSKSKSRSKSKSKSKSRSKSRSKSKSKSKSPEKPIVYENPLLDPLLRGPSLLPKKVVAKERLIRTLGAYNLRPRVSKESS